MRLTKNKDYIRLFVRREGSVVLGKHGRNLLLMTSMLLLTLLSVAFSNASKNYLRHKMEDPFVNWLNIPVEDEDALYRLRSDLDNTEFGSIREQFGISQASVDYVDYAFLWGTTDGNIPYLKWLFFKSFDSNPLLDAILDSKNVLTDTKNSKNLSNESIGLIVTQDVMERLGYSDPSNYPPFVNLRQVSDGAEQYGVKIVDNYYARVPVPLLAVVRNLPMNVDVVCTVHFYKAQHSIYHAFNLNNESYFQSLLYFVQTADSARMVKCLRDVCGASCDIQIEQRHWMQPWKDGMYVLVNNYMANWTASDVNSCHQQICEKMSGTSFTRLYEYDLTEDNTEPTSAFVSVQFDANSLGKIKEFQNFVSKEYDNRIKLEMTQVESKDNFSAVSALADVLTYTIILFAILCVVLFIVNLLRTYFQKVKRNMGTFKAFGMSNGQLVSIYLMIMMAMVLSSIVIALLTVVILQYTLIVSTLGHPNGDPFLSVWNLHTLYAILVIIVSAVITVYLVMHRQLRSTPGDIIYDR